jgi:hypothetical protein
MGHSTKLLASSRVWPLIPYYSFYLSLLLQSSTFGFRPRLAHIFPPLLVATSTCVARQCSGKEDIPIDNNTTTEEPFLGDCPPAEIEAIPLYALSNGKTQIANAHDGDYTL